MLPHQYPANNPLSPAYKLPYPGYVPRYGTTKRNACKEKDHEQLRGKWIRRLPAVILGGPTQPWMQVRLPDSPEVARLRAEFNANPSSFRLPDEPALPVREAPRHSRVPTRLAATGMSQADWNKLVATVSLENLASWEKFLEA